jgi:hypothetical protein
MLVFVLSSPSFCRKLTYYGKNLPMRSQVSVTLTDIEDTSYEKHAVIGSKFMFSHLKLRCSIVVKALRYKPEFVSSRPDEVNAFF